MEPVVEAFLANGTKYNLLNSAVLELVDFVRRENIKSLVQHIVENYEARLRPHSYTDAFTQLSRKHEQACPALAGCAQALGAGGCGDVYRHSCLTGAVAGACEGVARTDGCSLSAVSTAPRT